MDIYRRANFTKKKSGKLLTGNPYITRFTKAYLVAAAKHAIFNANILLYDVLLQSLLYAGQVHDRFNLFQVAIAVLGMRYHR
jgi:hypothetical protein